MAVNTDDVYWFVAVIYYTTSIFELLLVIFYFWQFYKRNPTYLSAYYWLLAMGYLVFFFYSFTSLLMDLFGKDWTIFENINAPTEWYFLFYLGFWNLLVGIYRSTAVGLPAKHLKIWDGKEIYVVILAFAFPFIINGYTLINPKCQITFYDPTDYDDEYVITSQITLITNITLSFLTLAIVIVATTRSLVSGAHTISGDVERRLIIQTILSTIFQIVYNLFIIHNPISDNFDTNIRYTVAMSAFMLQHYSNIVVLFVVSETFRNDVIAFFGVGYLAKSCFKSNDKVQSLKIYTVTTQSNLVSSK